MSFKRDKVMSAHNGSATDRDILQIASSSVYIVINAPTAAMYDNAFMATLAVRDVTVIRVT